MAKSRMASTARRHLDLHPQLFGAKQAPTLKVVVRISYMIAALTRRVLPRSPSLALKGMRSTSAWYVRLQDRKSDMLDRMCFPPAKYHPSRYAPSRILRASQCSLHPLRRRCP